MPRNSCSCVRSLVTHVLDMFRQIFVYFKLVTSQILSRLLIVLRHFCLTRQPDFLSDLYFSRSISARTRQNYFIFVRQSNGEDGRFVFRHILIALTQNTTISFPKFTFQRHFKGQMQLNLYIHVQTSRSAEYIMHKLHHD